MTTSALDGIPGLGETRRKALLRHFGSLKRLRAATVEDDHRGAGHRPRAPPRRSSPRWPRTAAQPAPAVNVTTGEVLDAD